MKWSKALNSNSMHYSSFSL